MLLAAAPFAVCLAAWLAGRLVGCQSLVRVGLDLIVLVRAFAP